MDIPVRRRRRGYPGWCAAALVAAAVLGAPLAGAGQGPQRETDVVLKAAFLYNFARFAEWPSLRDGQAIAVCIVGDKNLAAAFDQTARGKNIGGRVVATTQPVDSRTWSTCHVLFIGDTEVDRATKDLLSIRAAPVLTVSDAPGFARRSGLVELYVEDGRMRFAINVDALGRSGLQLSSRLLGLAKVVRDRELE